MNIEGEVFKRSIINLEKVKEYGFKNYEDKYIFEKKFLNDEFKVIFIVDSKGQIDSKVIDLETDEEYLNIRTDMNGNFVNKVRDEYKKILIDIRNNCFDSKYFIYPQTNRIEKYIEDKYSNNPEFLWKKYEGFGVFRNSKTEKWYAIVMNLDLSKLDNKSGEVEILNVKLEREEIKDLLKKEGYYEAYHMNKKDWISIVLNDTIEDNIIFSLIDKSYNLVSK